MIALRLSSLMWLVSAYFLLTSALLSNALGILDEIVIEFDVWVVVWKLALRIKLLSQVYWVATSLMPDSLIIHLQQPSHLSLNCISPLSLSAWETCLVSFGVLRCSCWHHLVNRFIYRVTLSRSLLYLLSTRCERCWILMMIRICDCLFVAPLGL